MATIDDIDIGSLAHKYLQRQTVTPTTNETADPAEEIQSLLESIAINFLLYPQTALSILNRAKNTLNQIVKADISLVDYLLQTLQELTNPDEPLRDVSDIIEAQTALVQLGQTSITVGAQSYDRYNAAINRFLNQQLAPSLKRRGTGEFERSGLEAKQDLFGTLSGFSPIHQAMLNRLNDFMAGVSNFQSINLTQMVSGKTIDRVRASLQYLLNKAKAGTISKTVIALEMMAGAAALQSISGTKSIYDPIVTSGDGTTILGQPEYLTLVRDDQIVTPQDIGVYEGALVSVSDGITTLSLEPIVSIQGNNLYFNTSLPQGEKLLVTITSSIVPTMQTLFFNLRNYPITFSQDFSKLQNVLSPLLSTPSIAQLKTAERTLTDIKARLVSVNMLLAIKIDDTKNPYGSLASDIINGLVDRGLDRAVDLLTRGRFSDFFGLTKENASKSTRLMKGMENFAQNSLPPVTIEADIADDSTLIGVNPDTDLLPRIEPRE